MSVWRDPSYGLDDDPPPIIGMLRTDAINRFEGGDATALDSSTAMKPHDPAYWMLTDGHTSTPVVHRRGCYICEDPEYAVMGLPLCYKCSRCGGHIAADGEICDDCGWCINPYSQTGGCGIAPDGWPERVTDDNGNWLYPYGDFETEEPFLVPRGTVDYAGVPEYDGDLHDDSEKGKGDYVGSLAEFPRWRGTVIAVKGYHVTRVTGTGSDLTREPWFEVTEAQVRIDDPAGSTRPDRQAGGIVRCRPGWLKIIRKKDA